MSTNKEIALGVSKAIINGEWKALDGMLNDSFTFTGDGMHLNTAAYIEFMQGMKNAMSNMNMDFTHVVEENDKVSVRFITNCKHTGNFMGAPATKKNLVIEGVFMRKIACGKVVQEWQATDLLGTLSQGALGLCSPTRCSAYFSSRKRSNQGRGPSRRQALSRRGHAGIQI